MPEPVAELREYVVELDVSGVAVVSVRAGSVVEASELAEQRCRPADVTELDGASARHAVRLPLDPPAELAGERDRVRERAAKAHERRAPV